MRIESLWNDFFKADFGPGDQAESPESTPKKDPRRNALIIQPGAVGDVILTLPLVRLLLRQPRMGEVDMMGRLEYLSYLQSRTELMNVIALDSIPLHPLFVDSDAYECDEKNPLLPFLKRYDLIVTFLTDEQGHFERNLIFTTARTHLVDVVTLTLKPPLGVCDHVTRHLMRQYLDQFPGMELSIEQEFTQTPMIFASQDDHHRGRGLLKSLNINPDSQVVAMHPGSGGLPKCWPYYNYRTLAAMLENTGRQPLFLWGPAEQDRWGPDGLNRITDHGKFPVATGLNLDQITCLLTCCAGYVGNDSGITHLAGALDVPTAAVFGPSEPSHWLPLGHKISLCREPNAQSGCWPTSEEVYNQLDSLLAKA
jgi:heptosyltransferase III